MIIKSIELQNFRNYEIEKIEFNDEINILYGDNAQGKTNILEAIYLSATTKSHKSSKDLDMILFNKNESHLKLFIKKNSIDYRIDIHIKKNKPKGIAVNGIPIKKSIDLYGIINVVLFSPEDLNIIKNGPSGRRKFMDMELCQLDQIYLSQLISYNRVLEQRNKLLKDIQYGTEYKDILDVWDMQLVKYGNEIIKTRRKFIEDMNIIINDIHSKLTGGQEKIYVKYDPSVNEQDYEEILNKSREKDIRTRMTSYGPHRDDILFEIDKIDIRRYGSQGQQRTTALSLKLAEIQLVKKITGENPVLLLDDVLSELDSNRQNHLLESIHNIQTIITCTGLDDFINDKISIGKIFKVINGHVYKEN